MGLHVFGIRHHGPGSARALRAALLELAPDAVLVEGPPDAAEVLPLVAAPDMVPPVALLVHATEDARRAVFYPFAEFSPEWQALRFACERGVTPRFIDLPIASSLVPAEGKTAEGDNETNDDSDGDGDDTEAHEADDEWRDDPLGALSEAAGYTDREQWWDDQVERRRDAVGLFEGILEAMTVLREEHPETRPRELRREAHMRQAIRAAQKEGFERIAVVCGAWHAPALSRLGPAKADQELLKGLRKEKVTSTWIPWTHSRLSFRSGYGAGVDSPGWYTHVWKHGERGPTVWATLAARLLREEDLDASSASVIETVRLAGALASLRGLSSPGLNELRDAIDSVLCSGQPTRLALIRKRLEIGEALGEVPEQAGQVPLQRDFEKEAKRLRLKVSAEQVPLDLDLRKETDLERSRLLHRLGVLGVPWGRVRSGTKGAGTFREGWQICWTPELAVDLIASNPYGSTVADAASGKLRERAQTADLSELTRLIELSIIAFLPEPLDALLRALDARAAASTDVRLQMEALEPLARVVRYSDVRQTQAAHVLPALRALFERSIVHVVPACTQLSDEAAAEMVTAIGHAHGACLLLDDATFTSDWLDALRALADGPAVHARIRGRAVRLLADRNAITSVELGERTTLALSAGVDAAEAAHFVEGLVEGEGIAVIHHEGLLGALDTWMTGLSDELFRAQLPAIRRAFSGLNSAERRAVARRVKTTAPGATGKPTTVSATEESFEPKRAALVLEGLSRLLGVHHG